MPDGVGDEGQGTDPGMPDAPALDEGADDRACADGDVSRLAAVGAAVRVSPTPNSVGLPSIACLRDGFAVAWTEEQGGTGVGWVYVLLLDEAGVPRGEPVRVDRQDTGAGHATVAQRGDEIGVAWFDYRNAGGNSEIYFARVSLLGLGIGEEVRITTAEGVSCAPALLPAGDEFALAWLDAREAGSEEQMDPFFVRLGPDGTRLTADRRVAALPGWGLRVSLADGPGGHAILWDDDGRVLFARIGPTGGAIGDPIDLGAGADPSLAWTGSGYGAAWAGGSSAHVARLDPDGVRVGPDTIVEARHYEFEGLYLAWTGAFYVLALVDWDEARFPQHVYLRPIGVDGETLGADIVASTPVEALPHSPQICFGNGHGAVVWVDARDMTEEVYFRRVDLCG